MSVRNASNNFQTLCLSNLCTYMVLMLTVYDSQNVANVCTHFFIGVKKTETSPLPLYCLIPTLSETILLFGLQHPLKVEKSLCLQPSAARDRYTYPVVPVYSHLITVAVHRE